MISASYPITSAELSINKHCSVCGVTFACTTTPGCKGCWCDSFPPIMPLDFSQGCRCPNCLQAAIHEHVSDVLQSKPISEVLEMAKPFSASEQLTEGIDYQIEAGNYVFTAWFHLKRGHCCGNGCRHCPYPKN